MSQQIDERIRQALPIPNYLKDYVSRGIDLDPTKSAMIPCPFHDDSTPSFKFDSVKKTGRCFGKCGRGGDVIAIYQWHQNLKTREEARSNLASLLSISVKITSLEIEEIVPDTGYIEYGAMLNQAMSLAKTTDQYLELDMIMSQYRPNIEMKESLELFVNKYKKVL